MRAKAFGHKVQLTIAGQVFAIERDQARALRSSLVEAENDLKRAVVFRGPEGHVVLYPHEGATWLARTSEGFLLAKPASYTEMRDQLRKLGYQILAKPDKHQVHTGEPSGACFGSLA